MQAEPNSTTKFRPFDVEQPPSKLNPTINRISRATTEEGYTNTTIDATKLRYQTKRFKFRVFLVLLTAFVITIVATVVAGLQFFFFQSLVHCPPGGPILQPQHQHSTILAPSSSSLPPQNKKKDVCPSELPTSSSNKTNATNSTTHSSGSLYCDDRAYVTTYANNLNGAIGILTLIMSLTLQPVFGSCSDKYGRRPFTIMSACCPLLVCISFQFAAALNSMPPEASGINSLSYAIIVLFVSVGQSFNLFGLMLNAMITDVVVSTLAPEGADPAASAASSVGSSLRQQSSQSSQSAHSGRSRARSRAGSSTRSRARSTIEEEVTAEQKLGKAIGLNMLLSSLAVIAGSLLTAAIAFHLPESFVPTWFIMSVPCIAAVLLACFAPETLATKVQSDDSSEEGGAEVRRVPIRSERSESFSLISFMDESGNNDCDDNFSLMMDNEEHNDNQDQEDQEDQEDAVKDRTEEDDDEKEPPSAPTCSKEWCRSSIFGFLIFLSENRPLAYVAAFLFLIGMQLASTEDVVAFMSLDLCLSPSTITTIGPIQSLVAVISVGCSGFVLARVGAISGLCFAGFISVAGLVLMSLSNVSIIFFFAGLLIFSTLAFSQVAYVQFVSARVDPSIVGGVQASLNSIFKLGTLVGKPLFLFLFAWPSLPNHYLFLVGAGMGIPTTAVIMYLKCTMPTEKK